MPNHNKASSQIERKKGIFNWCSSEADVNGETTVLHKGIKIKPLQRSEYYQYERELSPKGHKYTDDSRDRIQAYEYTQDDY